MDIFVNSRFNPAPSLEERLVKNKDLARFEKELVDRVEREFDNFDASMRQMFYSLDQDPKHEINRAIEAASGNEPENFY